MRVPVIIRTVYTWRDRPAGTTEWGAPDWMDVYERVRGCEDFLLGGTTPRRVGRGDVMRDEVKKTGHRLTRTLIVHQKGTGIPLAGGIVCFELDKEQP